MKILFIANNYLNLYKEIEKELIHQGHNVITIIDPNYGSYVRAKCKLPIRLQIKKYFAEKNRIFDKYWQTKCLVEPQLNQAYDLLFVIQGLSFSPVLLDHLRHYNPNIKSSLYIWDSNLTFDFFHNAPYFDKVFSFDWYDVQHDESRKVKYLPFFWTKDLEEYDNEDIVYDISSVGTSHDGRLKIFKTLEAKFREKNICYYFQLYIPRELLTCKNRIKLFCLKFKGNDNETFENLQLATGIKKYSFVTNRLLPPQELNRITVRSKSVLDTDRELQFGTTPRLIWALAANKHVYTTNQKVVHFPFFNEKYIHIIDRKNPVIDFRLLTTNLKVTPRETVIHLRIDNWIKNFL